MDYGEEKVYRNFINFCFFSFWKLPLKLEFVDCSNKTLHKQGDENYEHSSEFAATS